MWADVYKRQGYLDDAAAPFHIGECRAGHIHQPAAVQVDHGIHRGIGDGLPIAELAEAGRVHQERDAGVFRGKRCANVRDVGLAGEVGGYRAGGRVPVSYTHLESITARWPSPTA